jgi:alpha-amylase/alpha-mannosidase (GH57 family)
MERYICIHCHFYQPQRENPWLEAIELQDSAYPYHDWNERVASECYAPNSASRILDGDGRIVTIVNNYSNISFNFGPTVLSWMKSQRPEIYEAILEADRASRGKFAGHGNAIAQGYHHAILPLANTRDKRTEICWGVRDFEARFGRKPEGMWLPEAAVDLESLDIMAEQGLKFTVLSPHSASHVRAPAARRWQDVSGGRIDPSMPYRVRLKSGRLFSVFFYDGPVSHAVAFENLLIRGEDLAHRLAGAFSDLRDWPQLVHIATDGETYGHHKKKADMALAYALEYIQERELAKLTNYGQFLDRFPPKHDVRIVENSSWSCAHGVERWRADCGCSAAFQPGWKQQWRAPLREALYWLRDRLALLFERDAARHLRDPWAARDGYVRVILNRRPENIHAYLDEHARRELTAAETVRVLKLMELQRHSLLSFTSCGWFFDELSGIETVQVLQYASRALQLATDLFGASCEGEFLDRLALAKSNIPEMGDGRRIYERFVRPAVVDLPKVAAHFAVSALFEAHGQRSQVYCYTVHRHDFQLLTQGRAKLGVGHAEIRSDITGDEQAFSFGVLHLGEHNLSGGIREYRGAEAYAHTVAQIVDAFQSGDLPEVSRMVFHSFDSGTYTLKLLFRDAQRRILGTIMDSTLANAEAVYRTMYESQGPLMLFVKALNVPLPARIAIAAEFILNADLRREFDSDNPRVSRVAGLLDEVRRTGVRLDEPTIEFAARECVRRAAARFRKWPQNIHALESFRRAIEGARLLPFEADLWDAQNAYGRAWRTVFPDITDAAWIEQFRDIGSQLGFRVER